MGISKDIGKYVRFQKDLFMEFFQKNCFYFIVFYLKREMNSKGGNIWEIRVSKKKDLVNINIF